MSPDRKSRDAVREVRRSTTGDRGPRDVDPDATAHPSPARDLQSSLAESLQDAFPAEIPRWPGAVRLTIICGGSGLMWAGLIALGKAAFKL